MSIISNLCNQIVLSLDCFCAISSAEWETRAHCDWKQLLHKFILPKTEMAGTGMFWVLIIDLEEVNLASGKLITTLGSLVTWWALYFEVEEELWWLRWTHKELCLSATSVKAACREVVLCRVGKSRLCTSCMHLSPANEKWLHSLV